jgi:hypothetical protein
MTNPEEVITQLARGPVLIAGLIEAVPPSDLKRRPAPGKWSAHEHACHLAVLGPIYLRRLELILAEHNPDIISYEPDSEDPNYLLAMDLEAILKRFAHDRAVLVSLLRALPAEAWDRPARHTGHARYSLFLMCRHIAMHDGLHAYRIEESALGSHWPTERSELQASRHN